MAVIGAGNPLLEGFLENPYPALAFLRLASPVFHEPTTDSWLILKRKTPDIVLRSQQFGKDPRKGKPGNAVQRVLNPDPSQEPSMLVLDPPDHTRLRGLVNKAFTPHVVQDLSPRDSAARG